MTASITLGALLVFLLAFFVANFVLKRTVFA